MVEKKDFKIFTLLTLISISTILFQTQQLMDIKNINYLIWPVFTFFLLAFQKFKIQYTVFGIFFVAVYTLIVIQCVTFSFLDEIYLESNYLKIIMLPLCMYWIGVQLYKWSDAKLIQRFFICYLIATILLAISLQIEYIPSIESWMSIQSYLYDGKNSAAQILASGVLVSIFGIKETNRLKIFIKNISALYLFFIIGLLQCRTAMLGLIVAIFVYAFVKTKQKLLSIGMMVLSLSVLYNIPFIRQAFLLNKYQGADLNAFSSGRLISYLKTFYAFIEHPFFGNGHWYVDDFFICVLAELGIIVGGALIILWLYRVIININNVKVSGFSSFLLTLTIYYAFTSVLEAFSPFGPGSCSFLFWIMNGIIDRECSMLGGYKLGNGRTA